MWFRLGSLAFLAVLASGCMVNGDYDGDLEATTEDGAPDAVSDEGALGTVGQALAHTPVLGLAQGSPDRGLGPVTDRICYLTGMRGNFAGLGESARVYASNGSWWLSVTSTKTGVAAWAACAYTPQSSYSDDEYYWSTGLDEPTNMGSATDRVCFITGIAGGYDSTSDWVHAYVSGGQWFLTGSYYGASRNVQARCVSVTSYSSPKNWSVNSIDPAIFMGSGADVACALTRVRGIFDSSADKVYCDPTTDSWYLSGTSSHYVAAEARTF